MTGKRSTRNKLIFQAVSALADLKRAENHLAQLAGIAAGRSGYIDKNIPEIFTALRYIIESLDKFNDGL